jgi:hypothetical protein
MRPTPVRCSDLAVGKCEHMPRAATTTAGESGVATGGGSGGGRGVAALWRQGYGRKGETVWWRLA